MQNYLNSGSTTRGCALLAAHVSGTLCSVRLHASRKGVRQLSSCISYQLVSNPINVHSVATGVDMDEEEKSMNVSIAILCDTYFTTPDMLDTYVLISAEASFIGMLQHGGKLTITLLICINYTHCNNSKPGENL